jgi:hypothetical protein
MTTATMMTLIIAGSKEWRKPTVQAGICGKVEKVEATSILGRACLRQRELLNKPFEILGDRLLIVLAARAANWTTNNSRVLPL